MKSGKQKVAQDNHASGNMACDCIVIRSCYILEAAASASFKGDSTFTGPTTFKNANANNINVDTINEYTQDKGVTVEGVLLKDNNVCVTGQILVDTIQEKIPDHGVLIDGLLIKDSAVGPTGVNAGLIYNIPVSNTAPTNGQVLSYNLGLNQWIPAAGGGGGGGPSASSTQIVYVRGGGNDVTGNGTITNPYATITHAMSTITDALYEKRYMIDLGPGNWSDNFSWKAWVFMRGSYVYATRLTGTIDINDPSWAVAGSHSDERSGAQDINFSGTMTLNYAAVSSSYGKFYYLNCNMNNLLVITGFNPINQCIVEGGFWFGGITATGCAITWNGVSGQGGTITLNSSSTACSFTGFGGGLVGSLTLNYTSNLAPAATLIDCPVLSNLTISGTGATVSATNSSLPIQSQISVSGGGILNRLTDAYSLGYSPAVPANWGITPPNNVSSALDILSTGTYIDVNTHIVAVGDNTKKLNFAIGGTTNTITTLGTTQTTNKSINTPDIAGTLIVEETGTEMVYIGGPTGPLHGSNSGIQYSTTFASRAQYRGNQYGNNTGVPGISTFKSRGLTIGSLAPVLPGDVIFRGTAVGVTDNLSIPLAGMISINATTVPVGQGYISTEFELQLVSVDGPANGRRIVYKMDSEGRQRFLETTSPGSHTTVPSGVVALVGGTVTVSNNKIPANARIMLTIQPGPAPLGTIWVSAIVVNTSFTISSTNAGDTANIYYQVFVPL